MPRQHKATFSRRKLMALASDSVSMVSWSHDLAAKAPQLEIAGTSLEIYNNPFRAPQRGVVIRGTPEESCEIYQYWFAAHAEEEAPLRVARGEPPPVTTCMSFLVGLYLKASILV